ncbi:TRAP transporter small permease [Paenalcaligenes sp. Me131]|uniref:TRAP transporter small permease n=1 Tax=Paenalcaligenes sp. Me131 TaxID=3392636 RepID=UPI003D2E7DE3
MLKQFSNGLAVVERWGAIIGTAAVALLVTFNVVTRAMNNAFFWVDELAIYAMVWMLFLSISVLFKRRQVVAVTVLTDILPKVYQGAVSRLVDWVTLGFSIVMLVFCWYWFEPLQLIRYGFNTEAFSAATMNFIYQERVTTLPLSKFWVWLIIAWFSCSCVIHSLANIVGGTHTSHDSDGRGV